ncbi:MAG TPA: protease modulator HflC [Arenimonas sp.]|uniref:protease modulator HflC n=1 Tax=Arenimonas sp. TaxID=1872635 RepID=UPI002D7FF8CC|nr:protease modulator HflC [Arenimonas sp.]HEU0153364.1 protease modulator HflC [Arenimonas sp.]
MRNVTVIVFLAIAALLAAMGSMFVVSESQTAIVLNLGRVVRSDLQPGLHFKWPLVEEVRRFDQRILSLDDAPERYLTSEKKDVSVDFFVKWRISDVATYYRAANGGNEDAARQRLTPIVKNALRNEINQRTLQEVVSAGRAELSGNFLAAVNRGAESLGIEVVDVRIKRINLPDDSNILRTVYSRMSTERTQVANQLRAEGVEQSETIRSEADRQRQVTIAEAERDAQKLRGEGDAKAAEIYAGAYGQDAEFYGFYRSLEAYRESMADGQTVLVLDPDSEFLRHFGTDKR